MPMRFAVPPVLAAVLLALTSMPALADPSAADLAKATQAIAALSAYDWSVGDADELVRRVVTASSADSLQTLARGGEKRAETLLGIALAYGAGGFVADDDVSVKMLKAVPFVDVRQRLAVEELFDRLADNDIALQNLIRAQQVQAIVDGGFGGEPPAAE